MFKFMKKRDRDLGTVEERLERLEFLVSMVSVQVLEAQAAAPRIYNPMAKMERRAAPAAETRRLPAAISTRADGKKRIVEILIPYYSDSQDLGGFVEQIAPGAFARALAGAPCSVFWAHDPSQTLASTSGGSLQLFDSPEGLRATMVLRDTLAADDHFQSIARRDTPDVSFGFLVRKDRWQGNKRTLLDVDLVEITIGLHKTGGAYPGAQATGTLRARQEAELAELRRRFNIPSIDSQAATLSRMKAIIAELKHG